MTRLSRFLILCALAVGLVACSKIPPVFEDVGDDPDVPRLTLLGIGLQLPRTNLDLPPPPPNYVDPAAGITIRPYDVNADTLALRFGYFDAAADITALNIRDLDGNITYQKAFSDVFLGTTGVREVTDVKVNPTVEGPHRLEVWLEDVNGSRSATTTITVYVQLF